MTNKAHMDLAQVTKWPLLDRDDEAAILQVLRDGDLSTHRIIRDLEHAYAEYIGRGFALAHNNGTSALMAAFHGLGLQPGDEILVPTATFWASVLPMLWFGLVPLKMLLRWTVSLKYFVGIPEWFFNI